MKFAHPLMTVAAAFVFVASHQVHAASTSEAQFASDSPTVLVARADTMRSRESRSVAPADASPGKRGAHAAAQQGPEALRRYVDRTRMIYALDYQEFAHF